MISFSCETGKRLIGVALLGLLPMLPTKAAELPVASVFDSRIQYVDYNDGEVVILRLVTGVGSRIVFSPSEEILDVASGFSEGWEFEERRNILYVKARSIPSKDENTPSQIPVPGTWDTNLMVTTNKRLYDIDLQLLPSGKNARPTNGQNISYRVQFRYPKEQERLAAALSSRGKTAARMGAKLAPRNWQYTMRVGDSSESIVPTVAYDDGRFTYLKFPGNRPMPLVFLRGPKGKESLINSHIDPQFPDVMVIHRVAPEFILRLGPAVVGIYNEAFDANGVPPSDGSAVPGVKRTTGARRSGAGK